MKKRQWKKLKKKVRISVKIGRSLLNWREKLVIGDIIIFHLAEDLRVEIDNQILEQIRAIAEVQPIPSMDLTKIFPDKNGVYVLTGKPTFVYTDETHKGRMYPSNIFDKEVKDYEETNNSNKEDI